MTTASYAKKHEGKLLECYLLQCVHELKGDGDIDLVSCACEVLIQYRTVMRKGLLEVTLEKFEALDRLLTTCIR
jgi:hypothetical protein